MDFNFTVLCLGEELERQAAFTRRACKHKPLHGLYRICCQFEPLYKPAVGHGGGPVGPYQNVANLVSGAPVVGEPCYKVAPRMLEASIGNHMTVGRC